jgi:hypothetical protein
MTAIRTRRFRKCSSAHACRGCGSWIWVCSTEVYLPDFRQWRCVPCAMQTAHDAAERKEVLAVVQSHG